MSFPPTNPFVQRTRDSRSVQFRRQRSRAADNRRWPERPGEYV